MALSNAERQKRHYEKRQAKLKQAKEVSVSYIKRPFFQYAQESANWMNVQIPMDIAGLDIVWLEDDSDPKSSTGDIENLNPDIYDDHRGSIGRAEVLFNGLLDAATELASIINEFKRAEVEAALKETIATEATNPDEKKKLANRAKQLQKIQKKLNTNFRRTFPTVEVKEL